MASKKNTSLTSSDSYIGPITRGRSKKIQQKSEEVFVIATKIWTQMTEKFQGRINIKKNRLYESTSFFDQSNSTTDYKDTPRPRLSYLA